MRQLGIFVLAFWLAVVIHLDWHFALPEHHTYSLHWSQHWILPALGFFVVGLIIARVWPARSMATAGWAALFALVIAQGLVPVLEVAVTEGRLGYPTDPVRWSGFGVCMAVGLPALFTAAWFCRVHAPEAAFKA